MKRCEMCGGVSNHKGWCRRRIIAEKGDYWTKGDIVGFTSHGVGKIAKSMWLLAEQLELMAGEEEK